MYVCMYVCTSDLDKYADFIVSAISTAVDKAIPKSKSVRTESNPISEETLALIKEKRRLRRQYSQIKDPWLLRHALRRISSLRRNHSQRVSKYSLARGTISCHRMTSTI